MAEAGPEQPPGPVDEHADGHERQPADECGEGGDDAVQASDGAGTDEQREGIEQCAAAVEPAVVLDERPQRDRDLLALLQRQRELLGEVFPRLIPLRPILGEATLDRLRELARHAGLRERGRRLGHLPGEDLRDFGPLVR